MGPGQRALAKSRYASKSSPKEVRQVYTTQRVIDDGGSGTSVGASETTDMVAKRNYGYSQISVVNCGGFYLWKLPDAPRCSASGGGSGGSSDFGSGESAVPQTYCTVDVPMQ